MSKSIIEKLGITPGELEGIYYLKYYTNYNSKVVESEYENMDLIIPRSIVAAPEMIDALIDIVSALEEDGRFPNAVPAIIPVIQKATGKSWEEIKELINE